MEGEPALDLVACAALDEGLEENEVVSAAPLEMLLGLLTAEATHSANGQVALTILAVEYAEGVEYSR
jgi:hypothetical protein